MARKKEEEKIIDKKNEKFDENLNENETLCEENIEDFGTSSTCDVENKTECREEEFKEILQRVQAEFENYRRRTENQAPKLKEDGIIYAINKILPVLDSFKSAKQMVKDEEFLNSINLIEKQFNECLSSLNITKIEAEGKMFDPNFHNAVMTGKDEDFEEDMILDVFQDGYKLNDRVIRYSVVKINKL